MITRATSAKVAAALLASRVVVATVSTAADDKPVTVWDADATVTGGLGYRDNVLRSGVTSENSGFFQTSLDASVMRLSETDAYFMLYFLGDDIRYFDAPSVNYEQFFSGTARYVTPVGLRDEVGLNVNYLYQHQILDTSATEADLRRVLVLGHSLSIRPHWKRLYSKGWALKLEGVATGQVYESQLDSFWEGGAAAMVSKGYGNRSEVALAFESLARWYDTRAQADSDGFDVPDTQLIYYQNEALGEWRHNWNAARTWRTLTRLSYLLNTDNGSGYYDYDRLGFRQRVQWRSGAWSVETNLRLGWTLHQTQMVGDESRERSYAMLDLRVERDFWKRWTAYAAAENEWSASNDPRDDYDSWMVSGGLGLYF